jgi:aldehyde:ferredoxin oxidoreductase
VAVKGKMKVPVADEKRTKELRKKYLGELGGHIDFMRQFGTTFVTVSSTESGAAPVKNWGGVAVVDFPDTQPIGAEAVKTRTAKRAACYLCPVGCEAIMKEGIGEYKYEAGCHRPEYETAAMFGSNCLNNNIGSIIKVNDICNRYGVDTISAGATIAFAIECYENGLINKADTDGIEMTWGNHKAIVAMTEKLARREGFGDILADGVKVAARRIGKGADKYAIHIQGQEIAAENPGTSFDFATSYIIDATPGRHTQGSEEMHPPGLIPRFDRKSFSGRGELHKIGSNFQHSLVCAGFCLFVYLTLPSVDVFTEFMRAVTGWDITTDELLVTGERIANIRQAFNIREGLNPLHFEIPGRVIGEPPQNVGPLAGITIDKDTLVKEYIAEMDWDLETAKPSKKKLEELGLEDVAKALWP